MDGCEPRERLRIFLEFYSRNPQFYNLFRYFALQVKQAGKDKYAARSIVERMRWHSEVDRNGEFKVNNIVIPYYARLLMLREPEAFAGFFERRDKHFDVSDTELLSEVSRIEKENAHDQNDHDRESNGSGRGADYPSGAQPHERGIDTYR